MKKKLLVTLCALCSLLMLSACLSGENTSISSSTESVESSSVSENASSEDSSSEGSSSEDSSSEDSSSEDSSSEAECEHSYDNEYDATCNQCGDEREVPEDPVNGGNWTGEVPLQ